MEMVLIGVQVFSLRMQDLIDKPHPALRATFSKGEGKESVRKRIEN